MTEKEDVFNEKVFYIDLENGCSKRTQPHPLQSTEKFELGYFTRDRKYHIIGEVINPFYIKSKSKKLLNNE